MRPELAYRGSRCRGDEPARSASRAMATILFNRLDGELAPQRSRPRASRRRKPSERQRWPRRTPAGGHRADDHGTPQSSAYCDGDRFVEVAAILIMRFAAQAQRRCRLPFGHRRERPRCPRPWRILCKRCLFEALRSLHHRGLVAVARQPHWPAGGPFPRRSRLGKLTAR